MPKIFPCPGGQEFTWAPEALSVRLERLREHSDSITAELWATQGPEREHLVGGIRFALTTYGGRTTMAKFLASKRNGIDWGGVMEQVCVSTLKQFRSAEPLAYVGDLPTADIQFTLSPILIKGVINLLYGYGDSGKSTLALAFGALVMTGETRWGLLPTQGQVLFLDWETNREITNQVLKMLWAGNALLGTPRLLYRRLRRPFLERAEDIRADCQREGVALVIADSIAKACGGERELKENALPTMAALGELGPTILLLNHRPRSEEGRGKGSYGSSFVEFDSRQAFRVEASPPQDDGSRDVVLFHYKHNLMFPLTPLGFNISWDKLLGIKIKVVDPKGLSLPGVLEGFGLKSHALEVLKLRPLSFSDLASEMGIDKKRYAALRVALSQLTKAGKLAPLPGHIWALATDREEPPPG